VRQLLFQSCHTAHFIQHHVTVTCTRWAIIRGSIIMLQIFSVMLFPNSHVHCP